MIKATNISKNFGSIKILKNIDIEINTSEITVIIGPSGSGKTTLLNCLSMLNTPDKGLIQIDGTRYNFPNAHAKIRKQFKYKGSQQVGIVFQNINLIPNWTNEENITKPLLKTNLFDKSELNNLIDIFKVKSILHKLPHQCSRGEQQRIAFIRAVMLHPKYLYLDEVTSALDPELISILFNYLIYLKSKGTGIIVVTHFLLFAQNLADKIVFINQGEILEQGTKDIMINPKTSQFKKFLMSLENVIITNNNIE